MLGPTQRTTSLIVVEELRMFLQSRRGVLFAVVIILLAVASLLYAVNQTGSRGTYFVVEVLDEKFTIYVVDAEAIRLAMENLRGENAMHPSGELERGDGGFNRPWSWHLKPESVRMVEISAEVCDGTPSMVEANLDYWIGTVKYFCPWGARIVSASKTIPLSNNPTMVVSHDELAGFFCPVAQAFFMSRMGFLLSFVKGYAEM